MGTRYPHSKNSQSVENGNEFQDFAMRTLSEKWGFIVQVHTSAKYQLVHGESVQGIEIKYDALCTKTNRLSIEIAEKTNLDKPWVKSGIYSDPPSRFYIQGNFEAFWFFITRHLVFLHKSKKKEYKEKEEPTIRAFYLPFEDANKWGLKVL